MPNPRITSFECTYNLINYDAVDIATVSATNIKSFCDVSDLLEGSDSYSYITLEHNYSILDGSLTEFPNNFSTPFFSQDMLGSFSNGELVTLDNRFIQTLDNKNIGVIGEDEVSENLPTLSIDFSQPVTMFGMTFNFESEYPLEMEIIWTDVQNNSYTSTINPNKLSYVAPIEFIDCVSIDITFTQTLPYHYVKLLSILFGQVFEWTENEIKEGKLLLEQDIIGDLVSVNELTFKVIDKDNSYNLANDSGLHRYFQKRQEVTAYEYLNDEKIKLGTYFLDTFNSSNNLVELKCVSYIGILDNFQYNNGQIYNGTLAGDILEDIFDTAGIEDYSIDLETIDTPVYGTLKPMTCREALREVLFACGSIVDTTGDDGIAISKISRTLDNTIKRHNKISTKITQNEYVHGVEIEYTNYKLMSDLEDIESEQEYNEGTYTIIFDNAYTDVVITDENNNTITPSVLKTYYCTFTLNASATITIKGKRYEETTNKAQVTNAYLPASENSLIKTYSTTLCNATTVNSKAKDILDYLQYRLTIDVQEITDNASMNGRKWVENPNENYADFIAWYQSRSLNLTGGFIDDAKLVGYYYNEYDFYYAGTELYTGEDVGVI